MYGVVSYCGAVRMSRIEAIFADALYMLAALLVLLVMSIAGGAAAIYIGYAFLMLI